MSDITRECAKKAVDYCVENAGVFETMAWHWEDKYAELIVRECMAVVELKYSQGIIPRASHLVDNILRS